MKHNDGMTADMQFRDRLVRFQDGGLTADEHALFEADLAADAGRRRKFIDHMVESQLVHDRLRREAYGQATPPATPVWRSMLVSRAAAVVAGILLGTSCASIVLAYAVPIRRSTSVTILREGFEDGRPVRAAGMPSETGIWSGDYAEVVAEQDGVKPARGSRMLRFLRGDYEGRHIPESHSSDVFQLVDVRHLRTELHDGTAIAQLGALFNAAASAPDDPFFCTLTIFALDADLLHRGKPLADANVSRNSLAHSESSLVRLDRDPATWQRATNELRIPPNTDYLLIRTGFSNASHAPDRRTDEFGCQFVDEVRIVIGHRQEIIAP
jgi:hypothetical protein